MACLIALPIGIATLLAVPMHSTLHESELHVRTYASIAPMIFKYSEARRIFQVAGYRDRNGNLLKRSEIVLESQDGRRWHSGDNRSFETAVDPALAEFLLQKTELVMENVDTEADIPRYPNALGIH